MSQSEVNDNIAMETKAAWERLQKQLVKEPVNAQWVRWSKQENEANSKKRKENEGSLVTFESAKNANVDSANSYIDKLTGSLLTEFPAKAYKGRLLLNWMKCYSKWLSGAVAASVLAVTLFTPVGNLALASILSKFRMEEVTVVQEDDIERMMNGVFTEGRSQDAINKFGIFSHTTGSLNGEYSLADAEKLLNRKLIVPKEWNFDQHKLYISPSSEITLTLHVDEINKALQRLGAKKLLPESIDGKPVKLIFGENIIISKEVKIEGVLRYTSFSQSTAPAVEVDPSIPLQEAINAVLQFPFLPDYLKDSLKSSGALDNGNLPLPVIAKGTVEKQTIEGIQVLMTQQAFDRSGDSKAVKNTYYNLTWVKNGQLYNLSGNGFVDQNAVFNLAKELIQQ